MNEATKTNIETLWDKHYRRETESYHENMAAAFERMLADPGCEPHTRLAMTTAIASHKRIESLPGYDGSQPFTTRFAKRQ